MFGFWQRRQQRREAREQLELQKRGARHASLQTWLTLAGVLVAIVGIVVPIWLASRGGRDIEPDEPTISWRDRTWIIEGQVGGATSSDRVVLRTRSPTGDRHDTPLEVDADGRYVARLNGTDRLATAQVLVFDASGDLAGDSDRTEVSNHDPVDRTSDVDIEVYNKVVSGPTTMREDDAPAYLTDSPFCLDQDACGLPDTNFITGDVLRAFCQATGRETTNRYGDTANPENYDSTLWYGIELPDGRVGYLSEVWVVAPDRGGLSLPGCDINRP